MAPEFQPIWSGTLKSKKKNELQQICRELKIDFKSDAIKADLEQQIRDRFKEKPSLQADERYVKLDHISSPSTSSNTSVAPSANRRAARARSVSRPPREPEEDRESSVEDQLNQSPPRRSSKVAPRNPVRSEHATGSQNILVTLVNTGKERNELSQSTPKSKSSVTQPSNISTQLAKQTSQQVVGTFNAFARCTARYSINTVLAIQKTFSCPWKLCIIAILAELTFVICSTLPPRPSIFIPLKPDNSNRAPEPVVRLFNQIFSKSFLKPLIEYLSLSVMVPFVIAALMNVPGSQHEKNPKQKFKATRDLKPSVFVYCATRLAVLALTHLVFYPNHHFGWSTPAGHKISSGTSALNDVPFAKVLAEGGHLNGLESVQYVSTAFGMVIALHQLIRSC